MDDRKHRVVVVGGGFGGLYTARALKNTPVDMTLIDRRNFHLFQPLLYQVATGGLSPANIASPLRAILKGQKNTRVLLGEVSDIDTVARTIVLKKGEQIPYDSLVLATGAGHNYFGNTAWEKVAPGLKTIEEATEIRKRVLLAFEKAEMESDPAKRNALLTFVVIGGGATGVEMAGTLAEIAHQTLKGNFRNFNPATARVMLVEAGERVLSSYAPELSQKAAAALAELGVEVRTGCKVTDIRPGQLHVRCGTVEEALAVHNVVWAAGVQASPLARLVAEKTGAAIDRPGRVIVAPDLTLPGHPEIFVIGDMAHCKQDDQPLPGIATVAMQQGSYGPIQRAA